MGGPAIKELMFKSAMTDPSFGESPFGNSRWNQQSCPSAQSTPFAKPAKKGGLGRIESLGAEIRALGDDRSPLCEKSFQSSKQSDTPASTAVRQKTVTEEKSTWTESMERTRINLLPAEDQKQAVEQEDEADDDFATALFVICDDAAWSRLFDRCLMVLVTVLTVFTFAGAVEYEGRRIYPVTWRWLAQPLGLPEPVVALAFSRAPNAPY